MKTPGHNRSLGLFSVKLFVLVFVCFIATGCTASRVINTSVEGSFTTVPLPWVGDTVPRVIVSSWFSAPGPDQIEGRKWIDKSSGTAYNLVWKTPSWIAGGIAEVSVLPNGSLRFGGELGRGSNQSTMLTIGLAAWQKWWLWFRADVGILRIWSHFRQEIYGYQNRLSEVRDDSGVRGGLYLAGTIWSGDAIVPMLQFSIKSEDGLASSTGSWTPLSPDAAYNLGITPALLLKVTPEIQISLGYQINLITGLDESNSVGYPFIQLHYGL